MPNTINYAAVFNRLLDEKFYIMPRTMWMENTMPGLVWNNGKEIKVPMMTTDGLGNMNGCAAPNGDITLNWETKMLQYYRGRNFSIPRYDVDMTNFAASVDNVLRVFLNEQVIPEMDAVRIAAAAQAANNGGNVVATQSSTLTAANILEALMADIATVQDQIGETEQLYIQISTKLKNLLSMSPAITRFLNVRDFEINSANLRIEAINDQYLIGTPSAYMKAGVNLLDGQSDGQTAGGLGPVSAPEINWIIASRRAVDAIARPQVTKVITPDENQMGDCWKIMFNIFHGVWGYQNKLNGILVNMDTTLGALTATSAAGATAGTSVITVNGITPSTDAVLMYKVGTDTPAVGTALSGYAALPADGTITVANGETVTIALAGAASLKPLAVGTVTAVAN